MFIIVGKAIKGRWTGQEVVVGTLKENNLFQTVQEAQEALGRALQYLRAQGDVDPDSLRIATVVDGVSRPKIINLKGNH